MLDSNAVSSIVREPGGPVGRRVDRLTDEDVATSVIVTAELYFGLAKRPSVRLAGQLGAILERLTILPFEQDADRCYATIRADLERRGTPIDANDLLIAAHALAVGATLVTDNVREFARIDGLSVENWLRD